MMAVFFFYQSINPASAAATSQLKLWASSLLHNTRLLNSPQASVRWCRDLKFNLLTGLLVGLWQGVSEHLSSGFKVTNSSKSFNYICKKKRKKKEKEQQPITVMFSNNATVRLCNWPKNIAAQLRDLFLLITAQKQAGWRRRETGNLSISMSRVFVYTESLR